MLSISWFEHIHTAVLLESLCPGSDPKLKKHHTDVCQSSHWGWDLGLSCGLSTKQDEAAWEFEQEHFHFILQCCTMPRPSMHSFTVVCLKCLGEGICKLTWRQLDDSWWQCTQAEYKYSNVSFWLYRSFYAYLPLLIYPTYHIWNHK